MTSATGDGQGQVPNPPWCLGSGIGRAPHYDEQSVSEFADYAHTGITSRPNIRASQGRYRVGPQRLAEVTRDLDANAILKSWPTFVERHRANRKIVIKFRNVANVSAGFDASAAPMNLYPFARRAAFSSPTWCRS